MSNGVDKLPSGRWRWRVRVAGIQHSGTADTEAAARRARLDAELGAPDRRMTTDRVTVQTLVDLWLAGVEHAPSTAERRDIALAAIPAPFKAADALAVKPAHVAALWRTMKANGVGAVTVIKAKQALSAAFQLGVMHEMVPSNPFRIAPAPTITRKPFKAPPAAEVRAVLEAAKGRPELWCWLRIMATTGARPGEICALTWSRVDRERSTISLGPSVDRKRNLTDGKNGPTGWRDVAIDLPTMTGLRRLRRVVGVNWVWHHNTQPWRPDGVSLAFRRLAGPLGISWRLYDLRHFAASQAISAGRTIPEVARMLGDNPATVMRVYAHADGDGGAATAVAAVLDG